MERILLFAALVFSLFSCKNETESGREKSKIETIEKVISNHANGEPKFMEVYSVVDGEQELLEFKELYTSGKTRMSGKLDAKKNRVGQWTAFFENGNKWSTGYYENGMENGLKQVWYENGNLMYEGEMKNNKPSGEWSFWDKEEKKSSKIYK